MSLNITSITFSILVSLHTFSEEEKKSSNQIITLLRIQTRILSSLSD